MWRGVSATLLPPNGKGIQVTLPMDKDTEAGPRLDMDSLQEGNQVQTEPSASSEPQAATIVGETTAPLDFNSRQVPHSAAASSSPAEAPGVALGPCLIRKEPEVRW